MLFCYSFVILSEFTTDPKDIGQHRVAKYRKGVLLMMMMQETPFFTWLDLFILHGVVATEHNMHFLQ